ncbi:MAG: peptidyl-tRNA hydrolase [Verrucomicrobiota bacterium]|jgi:PTH1 family peptidyl-tRNA hydrolase
MDKLHVIVGLGNPGAEYARTRHNAGFLVLDQLAERWKLDWKQERKFEAFISRGAEFAPGGVLLCKPQTFMNASGETVGPLAKFYNVTADRCLVIVDDADLPFGEIRLRPKGSSGGHHGLESIEQHLASREFPRLRIGIGRQGTVREITGHVLGRFSKSEAEVLEKVLERAADQVECWRREGIQKAMNKFNGAVAGSNNEGKEQ